MSRRISEYSGSGETEEAREVKRPDRGRQGGGGGGIEGFTLKNDVLFTHFVITVLTHFVSGMIRTHFPVRNLVLIRFSTWTQVR